MNRMSLGRRSALVGLLGLILVGPTPARQPPQPAGESLHVEKLKPVWRVGDRWIVETMTLPLQVPTAPRGVRGGPVRWEFSVERIERVGAKDCFRVEVRPLLPGRRQLLTTFWVERRSLVLQQLQTQLPVAGGYSTLIETYEFPSGQPSPVQGPWTVVPIDMPLFLGDEVKGLHRFSYEAIPGPPGQKALGDLGFAFEIEQDITRAKPERVRGLLDADFTKDLESEPIAEVRLRSVQGQVRQLWRLGQPWPAYAENGTTTARLVRVIPAQSEDRTEARP